ncbi:septum site-determining protein MinD [Candidatus Pacearchaeota archaeon]|nr:septum site-determining protein MinD [Candidatus Pacearchaeota archaeon]
MGKIYAILSGKGGVGKTTTTINLGISLNSLGKEVIIVDTNMTTPNVGLHLGSPIVPVTLNHVMKNEAKIEEAIYEHETGTKIIPSSLSISELKSIDTDKIADIGKKLKKISDHVFLDSAAGLGEESRASIKAADEIIIVTNPEITAVTDALKTIKLAEQMNRKVLGAIVTRYTGKKWEMDLPTVHDMLEVPIIGVIPEDDSVKESHRMKNAVIVTHPKSKAARAYKVTARRILNPEEAKEKNKERQVKEKKKGFFSRLAKSLGL